MSRGVQDMLDSARCTRDATTDQPQTRMILRPRSATPTALEAAQIPSTENAEDAEMDTYRLLHPSKTFDLFDEANKEHQATFPGCTGKLRFHLPGEIQRGLCWREQHKCDTCTYLSPRRKLYNDVKSTARGPKAASANVGSQFSMMHTGISNTGFARILVSSNTPAPAKSSMQATANRMSDIVQKVNKEDMAHIREDIMNSEKRHNWHKSYKILYIYSS